MDTANFVFRHPLGPIYGWFSQDGLQRLQLPRLDGPRKRVNLLHYSPNITLGRILADALGRHFSGMPEAFNEIPLDYPEATDFQRSVWDGARKVPWGTTCSYADLGQQIGRGRGAARAIGQALGANPIPILVPCHRFLAADGSLGGFSAGLKWKQTLLETERIALV